MAVAYDEYYQSENLFGTAYPELIEFFKNWENRGKLLDLGCGQGRDAIPLAKMGYQVTAIDHSSVGIGQLNDIAIRENLPLEGLVADIFTYQGLEAYDFILLDSMFHFTKGDLQRETGFIKRVISQVKEAALIAFFIQDTGNKVKTLNSIIASQAQTECIQNRQLVYTFEDSQSKHKSVTDYRMLVFRKSPNPNHQ